MAIVKYEHHGIMVSVHEEVKGKHAEHCMCYANCKHFKPNTPNNCPIAQGLFEYDCANGVTTPVFECAKFEEDVS